MSEAVAPQVDHVEIEKQKNFAELRKIAEQERAARIALEQRLEAMEKSSQTKPQSLDDEDDDEPYVDRKKLNKFGQKLVEQTSQTTAQIVKSEVEKALHEERRSQWFRANPDFQNVMSNENLNKLEAHDPELAAAILKMPDEFERQKLAYRTVKSLKLDQPQPKQQSIQDKVDANRRSPYYQPSGVGAAPYDQSGNISPENAYKKMQQLILGMKR